MNRAADRVQQRRSRDLTRLERFRDKLVIDHDEHWIWFGAFTDQGYPAFWDGASDVNAGHWAWEQDVGPIPEGMSLHHPCAMGKKCVNPEHARLGTKEDEAEMGRAYHQR